MPSERPEVDVGRNGGGRKSRDKGAGGENEACKLIRPFFPDAARELDQYQESLGRDLKETQPFCIQVKRLRTVSDTDLLTALAEAESAIDECYEYPIVMARADRRSWKVFCRMCVLVETMGALPASNDDDLHLLMDADEFFKWWSLEDQAPPEPWSR